MVIPFRSARLFPALTVLAFVSCSHALAGGAASGRLLRREQRLEKAGEVHDTGSDPYRVLPLPGSSSFLLLLRGSSRVLLADGAAQVSRETPRSPTAWDLVEGRYLFVGGELSNRVRCFEVSAGDLRPRFDLELPGVASVRDLVYVEESRRLLVLDSFRGLLLEVALPAHWREAQGEVLAPPAPLEEHALGPGPLALRRAGAYLIVDLLLQHALLVLPLHEGRPELASARRIEHDGPIWSFDAIVRGDALWIAAGGVEDRPLDRSSGEFGFVDSYLFLYRLPRDPRSLPEWDARQRIVRNLSELGVVTPKALRFEPDDAALQLRVTGYGAEAMAELALRDGALETRELWTTPPGITDFFEQGASIVAADPLLDRVLRIAPGRAPETLWSERGSRPARLRLGEALFYTTLLTPQNRTENALSRFTCETCHFEGAIDGRVHFTGRAHVFATTKPLLGLANNVPLFSRAGDATLSSMLEAEFRVANQGRHDRLSASRAEHPWLAAIPGLEDPVGPEEERLAFLEFLAGQAHRPNPWRAQGAALPAAALHGLEVFRRRCADCHQPRTSTREGGRLVPFAEWRSWLEGEGKDLVWGAPFLSKTGIEPYVDPAGARVPSLRRVALKYPYFTDGSSRTLRDVLLRFRYRGASAWHDARGVEDARGVLGLGAEEVEALSALLQFF